MSYNIGPKIGIDGEKEFRSSIRNINDTYKALEAETKAVTKSFDAQGDEQGKLEATSKQLQKQIDLQIWDTDAIIYGDADLLTDVLVNLIDNAVKASPIQGKIKLYTEKIPTESGENIQRSSLQYSMERNLGSSRAVADDVGPHENLVHSVDSGQPGVGDGCRR